MRTWSFLTRTTYRRLINWTKSDALSYYPALKALGSAAGMERLREYEREERQTCNPWLRFFPVAWFAFFITLALTTTHLVHSGIISWSFFINASRIFFLGMPFLLLIATCIREWRSMRFIDAKIAEEFNGGRWWNCVKCGRDLSAARDQCPKCGASVYVLPPTKTL